MSLLTLLLLGAGAPDPAASLERDVRALIGIRTSSAPSRATVSASFPTGSARRWR